MEGLTVTYMSLFLLIFRGEYRVVYLTPEYASLDTGFLAQVQKSVGKDNFTSE